MLNLFRKTKKTAEPFRSQIMDYVPAPTLHSLPEPQVEPAIIDQRPPHEIVQEIHETFYTEVDRLLADAKILNTHEVEDPAVVAKAQRLAALGFTGSQEVKKSAADIDFIDWMKNLNAEKEKLKKAIEYFSFKYPHYKFITEDSVNTICKRYGLVYGEASRYTGTIPENNLREIEAFKIDEADECYISSFSVSHRWGTDVDIFYTNKAGVVNAEAKLEKRAKEWEDVGSAFVTGDVKKSPFEIAAPASQMKEDQKQGIDFDPVVLAPVFFEDKKHYLIVTAWGLEASDDLVINPVHN